MLVLVMTLSKVEIILKFLVEMGMTLSLEVRATSTVVLVTIP